MSSSATWRMIAANGVVVAAVAGNLCFNGTVLAKKPGGGGGGQGKTDQDMSVCITMDTGGLMSDGGPAYCGSDSGVNAYVGGRRTITFRLKSGGGRSWALNLGQRLSEANGDPDPNDDGGVVSGNWLNHPVPVLPSNGIVGELLIVGPRIQHLGEPGEGPNPLEDNVRLKFDDASGQGWTLFWGPNSNAGGAQLTNAGAPKVRTARQDIGGQLVNAWDVETLGSGTAFLWRQMSNGNAQDYWGAFDVSFSFEAVQE